MEQKIDRNDRDYCLKCVGCGENVGAYVMDEHLSDCHDVNLFTSASSCAWCREPLLNNIDLDPVEKHVIWCEHLLKCDAYAAWCLSRAEVWNAKKL